MTSLCRTLRWRLWNELEDLCFLPDLVPLLLNANVGPGVAGSKPGGAELGGWGW